MRAEKFLDNIPIRRQTIAKTAAKTLTKIKKMLQAYALARPYLFISLKVIKTKDEKANWKYPTHMGARHSKFTTCSLDATTDILGRNLTDQCERTCSRWSDAGDPIQIASETLGNSPDQAPTYTFEAVLAKRDCGKFATH